MINPTTSAMAIRAFIFLRLKNPPQAESVRETQSCRKPTAGQASVGRECTPAGNDIGALKYPPSPRRLAHIFSRKRNDGHGRIKKPARRIVRQP